jgi:hypothetical protein
MMNGKANAKRKAAEIISSSEEEEAWPEHLNADFFLRLEMLGELVEYCREIKSPETSIERLLLAQQEVWMLTELYFMGLGPRAQEAEAEQIAPQWQRLNELMESNREKAQALMRKRAS